MAIVRPVAAILSAIYAGLLVMLIDRPEQKSTSTDNPLQNVSGCCASEQADPIKKSCCASEIQEPVKKSCCSTQPEKKYQLASANI